MASGLLLASVAGVFLGIAALVVSSLRG